MRAMGRRSTGKPTAPSTGLEIGCVPARACPFDAFVGGAGESLATLPPGSIVGTSSIRRVVQVRALRPDFAQLADLKLGVVGACDPGEDTAFEVRAFVPGLGIPEDPVTGSLNAGLAQWLIGAGLAPSRYVAAQGSALGRAGRVHVQREGEDVWIGGDVAMCVEGEVTL